MAQGTTIVHETNPDRLAAVDVDDLDDFAIVELDVLISLDFTMMAEQCGLKWTEGDPIRFDEHRGLAVSRSTRHASGIFSRKMQR